MSVTRVVAVPEVMVDNEVLLVVGGCYEVAKEGKVVCRLELRRKTYASTESEEEQPSSKEAHPSQLATDKSEADEEQTQEPAAKKPKTT